MSRGRALPTALLIAAGLALIATGPAPSPAADAPALSPEVARLRNIGKAYFENGVTLSRALDVFTQAVTLSPGTAEERVNLGLTLLRMSRLDQARAELERAKAINPSLVHAYYALGLVAKRQSDFPRAAREFEAALRLDPADAATAFQLGISAKDAGDVAKAEAAFAQAARIDPTHTGARFELYQALAKRGKKAEAEAELDAFNRLKRGATTSRAEQDAERGPYSEPIAVVATKTATPPASAPLRLRRVSLAGDLAAAPPLRAVHAVDLDGDGLPELLAIGTDGAVVVFRRTGEDTWTATAGEVGLASVTAQDIVAGDFTNHRIPDLWLTGPGGGLWRAVTEPKKPPRYTRRDTDRAPTASAVRRTVLLDYDHDNDLDLLVIGAKTALWQNNGDGTFTDASTTLDSLPADAVDAVTSDLDNRIAADLVLLGRDGTLTIYRDLKAGRYQRQTYALKTAGVREAYRIYVEDLDNDGRPELIVTTDVGIVVVQNRGRAQFQETLLGAAMMGLSAAPRLLAVADLNNDGWADLVVADPGQPRLAVLVNRGGFRFAVDAQTTVPESTALQSLDAADLDGDGLVEVVGLTTDGRLVVFAIDGPAPNRWLRVTLTSTKGVRSGVGARIEARAGHHYVRRQAVSPLVHLGLAAAGKLDVVRITWPDGFVQNELDVATNTTLKAREAERVAGSCPTIFTWDGERFVFVTDAFISGPMGMPLGTGHFPVDHDEYVLIPGSALKPRAGALTVQITEELREVVYLDHARLWAVDHPVGAEIVPNEWFGPPPFPAYRLHTIVGGRPPRAAYDDTGADVLALIMKLDGRWPQAFARRTDYLGLTEPHSLTLDLGDLRHARRIMLYLTGWFEYFEASTMVALAQQSTVPFMPPSLQVRDAAGQWVTVLPSLGLPSGKNKTVPVDLTGKFLTDDFHVRIVTNLAVYWDRILVDTSEATAPTILTETPLSAANVHFRGFSRPITDPERRRPERFDYSQVTFDVPWGQLAGLYTRYGDVAELLEAADDRFVIFGAGDETSLTFDASRLPALPPGWRRDYLLYLDGWVKDGDPNTAFGDTVEPLPFHAMSGYPYRGDERPADIEWTLRYNTRPAVELWPAL